MNGKLVSLRGVLTVAGLVALGATGIQAQGLTPEQVVSMETVSASALSPDGRSVAYALRVPRSADDPPGSARTYLHLMATGGGDPTPIPGPGQPASAPAWSPDGGTLAFLATLPGFEGRQVYSVPAGGGTPTRLTSSPTSVLSFAWSPDGRSLAFTAMDAESPEDRARRERGDDVIVMSVAGRATRLWLQPLSGDARPLSPDGRTIRSFVWAPNGRSLTVQWTERTDADADMMFRQIHTIPIDGGPRSLLVSTEGKLGPMAWSPTGAMLAYVGAVSLNDPLAQSVFVASASGGEPVPLTEGYEGSVVEVAWLDDATVAFVAQEGTRTTLNRVRAMGGSIERMAGGGSEIFGGVDFDRDRRTFAAVASTASHGPELYVGTRDGDLTRLTHHNPWLDRVALGRQETVTWTGPDDLEIQGVLIHPVGATGGPSPLVILPHGGPEGVSLDGWSTNPLYPAQVLAGQGYAVLMPNYRGSGGRGVAFSKADHRDLGGEEFDDVLAGIDQLAGMGLVDPDRVGISGTSYGGYFSAWAATRHSERFKVALPFAGITNWTSFTGTTDIPFEMSVVHFDRWYFDNPGLYWDRSPLAYVAGAATPTLIGHGMADERVHPEQSMELYQALKLQGVPVELVLYPREPHGLLERAHQLDYMSRIVAWMDRYLKPGATPVS